MDKPLISVLMTVYNTARFLRQSIESVLSQTYTNFQFIIVNDGSTDDSYQIMCSYDDPRIEIYEMEKNSHISCATNAGFVHARGDYLAIMDSDDLWDPKKLEKQLAFMAMNPQHQGCLTWMKIIDEEGHLLEDEENNAIRDLFCAQTMTREEWLRFFFFAGNRINNPSSLVTMESAKCIGNHHPGYVQAHDFAWWVAFTKRFSFGFIEEPLTCYRRFSSPDHANTSEQSEENMTRFYNEYMDIRFHFFDGMPKELFLSAFGSYFRNPDSSTDQEILCEQAFLMLKPFNQSHEPSAAGLTRLFELLKDEEICGVLERSFDFTPKSFYEISGQRFYNDPTVQQNQIVVSSQRDALFKQQCHIEKIENELNESKRHGTELASELNESKQHSTKLADKLEQAQIENGQLKDTCERLNAQINEMQQSTSWKITSPMRTVGSAIKRQKR